jgi:hypothetical protein
VLYIYIEREGDRKRQIDREIETEIQRNRHTERQDKDRTEN